VTNSFAPPTPTFFYQTHVSDRWAVLGQFWRDIPLTVRLDFYVGGGVGRRWSDDVRHGLRVHGAAVPRMSILAKSAAALNWQYKTARNHGLGYRYMDCGNEYRKPGDILVVRPAIHG